MSTTFVIELAKDVYLTATLGLLAIMIGTLVNLILKSGIAYSISNLKNLI
jgi:HAMP domain-containing protein